MIEKQEINFRELYPTIPDEKIIPIQKYYNTKLKETSSDSAFKRYRLILNAICVECQDFGYIPFRQWDAEMAKSLARSLGEKYSSTLLVIAISIIKDILITSGCSNDLSSVTPENIMSEFNSPLLSFTIFNNTLKRVFQEERPQYTWKNINSWTTGIVIAYLFWLGYTRDEIVHLKKSDFDERTGIFIYQGQGYTKKRSVADRTDEATEAYITNYFNCKSYEVYSDYGGWRNIPFINSDTFVKFTSSDETKMKENVDNYLRKMRGNFGFGSPEILTAGRMDRLYYLDKIKNIPITAKNAAVIADDLNVKLTQRIRFGTEIGDLIFTYNSYKEKREALHRNA